jgi:PAS domain S-box-containing protein
MSSVLPRNGRVGETTPVPYKPSLREGDVVAPGDTARSWAGLPPMLAAGFCAIGLVLVVAFLATVINLRRVYGTAEAVAQTQAVIGALQRLLATAVDAETGQRGFIITGREAYLEPYDRARAEIAAALAQVHALTASDPVQQDDIERLRSLTELKLAELAEAIRLRRESGFPAAQALVMTNTGKQTMDAMRAAVSQMRNREDALLARRVAQATSEYRSALFTSSLTAALSLLAVVGLFLGTVRLGDARRRAARLAEHLRVTLTSIGDGVVVTDVHGCVTELNPIAEALTGWTTIEAVGRRIEEVFVIIHAQTRRPAEVPIARVLRDGVIAGLANHTVLMSKDGREIPIEDSAAPIRTSDGRFTGVVMVFRDVTERYRAELDRAVLADAERLARLRAEAANRAKDEFLAMLGHELRNPLSPIMTALHLMKLRTGDSTERERLIIERQATHLTRLVEDLLDVSRITRGKLELNKAPIEMADVITDAIEMCGPFFAQKRHTLSVEVPRTGLPVLGDATRLGQIVSNLLTNAAKYTPPAGRVTILAAREQDYIVVRIRDTGIGIAPDALRRIFDLFVQERTARERADGGLGLGLTIVQRLVEAHDGTIEAHSDGVGAGSEFVLRLPVSTEPLGRAHEATELDDV